MNVTDMAVLSAKAIDKRRGENVTIIDIGGKSSIADYMILGSGASERLIAALRDEVEETLAKEGIFVKTIEGKKESGWILMDYGDIIVNLMTYSSREKYNLETIWGDCDIIPFETEE